MYVIVCARTEGSVGFAMCPSGEEGWAQVSRAVLGLLRVDNSGWPSFC